MKIATKEFLAEFEALCERRKQEIRNTPDIDPRCIGGTTYYVSNDGDDSNDGLSPQTPWKTLNKVTEFPLAGGDCVRFRRGDIFRGLIMCKPCVTYTAYGEGEKPRFYGWKEALNKPELWVCVDEEHHIWKYIDLIPDVGNIVFNDGEFHSRKLIPSYIRGRFMCRDDESKPFIMADEMTQDLDIFCYYVGNQSRKPSKGEDFPIPTLYNGCDGELFLRCDRGNPGEVFDEVEAVPRNTIFRVSTNPNVHIDNVCIKYSNFGISAGGYVIGLHVTNCEIGWIGGSIQCYDGTDPNYPEGTRGSVTRFGNGIEVYGGCENYRVTNCYTYEIYDAAMSHQISTVGRRIVMRDIKYQDNLIDKCVYGIEYFLDKNNGEDESFMEDIEMSGNIIINSGYGWGQQRHNKHTPAHIKGWSYDNTASNYRIHDNVLGRAGYKMVHLVAKEQGSCPKMYNNTYIQALGAKLGRYGGNKIMEPDYLVYDENVEEKIKEIFGEEKPSVYIIK